MHARNRQQLLLGIRTLYLIVGKPLLTSQPRLAEDVGFERYKGLKDSGTSETPRFEDFGCMV